MLLEDDRGNQSNQSIAIQFTPFMINRCAAIYIRIKNDAKVSLMSRHRLTNCRHRCLILRIGHMVGKVAIGL